MNKSKVLIYVIVLLGFVAMGVVIGMMLQQAITQSTMIKIADNLDGVQIDIDLNETQIVEGITDFYKPYFDELINDSSSINNSDVVNYSDTLLKSNHSNSTTSPSLEVENE